MKSDLNNLKFFYNSYIKDLNNKLSEIPLQKIFKAVKIIEKTIKKKIIFMFVAMEDLQQ